MKVFCFFFALLLAARPAFAGEQEPRAFLYRETPGYGGQQSVRAGDWKAVRQDLNPRAKGKDFTPGKIELYDLANDRAETKDVAEQHPEIVEKLGAILKREHTKSGIFPIRALD